MYSFNICNFIAVPNDVQNLRVDGEPTSVSLGVAWNQPASGIYDGYVVYIAGADNVQVEVARLSGTSTTSDLIEVRVDRVQ